MYLPSSFSLFEDKHFDQVLYPLLNGIPFNPDVGTLRLYQPTSLNSSLLWQMFGNQGNSWTNVLIDINSTINWQVGVCLFCFLSRWFAGLGYKKDQSDGYIVTLVCD